MPAQAGYVLPCGREAGSRLLETYLEVAKHSGLIAEGSKRSGQGDATVAHYVNVDV